jgi:hypothetical protein
LDDAIEFVDIIDMQAYRYTNAIQSTVIAIDAFIMWAMMISCVARLRGGDIHALWFAIKTM